ncbi:T9SS type A sorting domain-containing protein [bacterium]|nr:T9SS type A sorting domain-containing protein [bacterium]
MEEYEHSQNFTLYNNDVDIKQVVAGQGYLYDYIDIISVTKDDDSSYDTSQNDPDIQLGDISDENWIYFDYDSQTETADMYTYTNLLWNWIHPTIPYENASDMQLQDINNWSSAYPHKSLAQGASARFAFTVVFEHPDLYTGGDVENGETVIISGANVINPDYHLNGNMDFTVDYGGTLIFAPYTYVIADYDDVDITVYGSVIMQKDGADGVYFDNTLTEYGGNSDYEVYFNLIGFHAQLVAEGAYFNDYFYPPITAGADLPPLPGYQTLIDISNCEFEDCHTSIDADLSLVPLNNSTLIVDNNTRFRYRSGTPQSDYQPSCAISATNINTVDIEYDNFNNYHHNIYLAECTNINISNNSIDLSNADEYINFRNDNTPLHNFPRGILIVTGIFYLSYNIDLANNNIICNSLTKARWDNVYEGMGITNGIRVEKVGPFGIINCVISGNRLHTVGNPPNDEGMDWYAMAISGGSPYIYNNFIEDARMGVYEIMGATSIYRDYSIGVEPFQGYVGNDFYCMDGYSSYGIRRVGTTSPLMAHGYNRFNRGEHDRTIGLFCYSESWPPPDNEHDPYSMVKNYWGTDQDVNEFANWRYCGNNYWAKGWVHTRPSAVTDGNYENYDEAFDLTPVAGVTGYVFDSLSPASIGDLPVAEQALEAGRSYMRDNNISSAITALQTIWSYGDDNLSEHAIRNLIECQLASDPAQVDLSSYFSTLASQTSNKRLIFLCNHGVAQIKAQKELYSDAIFFYESVMDDGTQLYINRIDAEIYAMGTYLREAGDVAIVSGDPTYSYRLSTLQAHGSHQDLIPSSLKYISETTEELYAAINSPYAPNLNITSDTTWLLADIYLEDDVTVSQGATLTILPGTWIIGDDVTIDVYGKIEFLGGPESPTIFSCLPGATNSVNIVLHEGCDDQSVIQGCEFRNSTVAVTVEEELTTTLEYLTFIDCEKGIYVPVLPSSSAFEIYIDNCRFESAGSYDDSGIVLNDPAQGSAISECNFHGAMYPITINSGSAIIEDCYFEVESAVGTENDVAAINLTYFSGQVLHNSIYRFPTGIRLYDSDIFLRETKIEECWNEGLWLLNDSHPVMNGTYGPMNWLCDNGEDDTVPAQIRIEGNVYPYMADGQNNIWQATNGYAISSVTAPSSSINLEYNYWGTATPNGQNLFNPYSAQIDFDPCYSSEQTPTGGYQTESIGDNLFAAALGELDACDFDDAIAGFQQVVAQDNVTSNRVGALSRILDCYMMDGSIPSSGLYSYYGSVLATETDERVRREAEQCVALLDISEGEYDSAIDYYEGVILDPNASYQDSVYAVIDLGYAYLASDGNGGGISSMDDLYPRTVAAHQKHVDELMTELRINRYRVKSAAELLPTEFALQAAYPNPFNPSIMIPYDLPEDSHVEIAIYNVMGQKVETLVNTREKAGYHHIVWNSGANGKLLASGVYFVQMKAADFIDTQKIVMLK